MKRLILIGNGPVPRDISEEIDSFDYVFRINRMCNLLLTCPDRIDGLFMATYDDFKNEYKGGVFKDYFKSAKQIFMTESMKRRFREWRDYITEEQYNGIQTFNFFFPLPFHLGPAPTTTIRVLNILVNDPKWYKEYEIWIAGITVDGRAELMRTGDPWKNTNHDRYGDYEERFLKKLVDDGKIKLLFPEEYPRSDSGKG